MKVAGVAVGTFGYLFALQVFVIGVVVYDEIANVVTVGQLEIIYNNLRDITLLVGELVTRVVLRE